MQLKMGEVEVEEGTSEVIMEMHAARIQHF